jgi:hypothetical protein
MDENPINLHLMRDTTLKARLREWTDWDSAGHSLGISLGLMPNQPIWGKTKHVFWTNHPTGVMFYTVLECLVEHGVLEKRDGPDIQYRWSPSFRGDW